MATETEEQFVENLREQALARLNPNNFRPTRPLGEEQSSSTERYRVIQNRLGDEGILHRDLTEAELLIARCEQKLRQLHDAADTFRDAINTRIKAQEIDPNWVPEGWSLQSKVQRMLQAIIEKAEDSNLTYESPELLELFPEDLSIGVHNLSVSVYGNGAATLYALASSGVLLEMVRGFEQAGSPLNSLDVGWFDFRTGPRSFLFEGPEIAELATCYPYQIKKGTSPLDALYNVRWLQDQKKIPKPETLRTNFLNFLLSTNYSDEEKLAHIRAIQDLVESEHASSEPLTAVQQPVISPGKPSPVPQGKPQSAWSAGAPAATQQQNDQHPSPFKKP